MGNCKTFMRYKRLIRTVLPLLLIVLLMTVASAAAPETEDPAWTYLQERAGEFIIMMVSSDAAMSRGGEPFHVPDMLERFYRRRHFQPAWLGRDGSFPHTKTMLDAIGEVQNEGLSPDYYHRQSIAMLSEQLQRELIMNPETMAELDVLLTDAFLMLGCHFSAGCEDPLTTESGWFVNRDDLDVSVILEDALRENNIRQSLDDLLPLQPAYSGLKQQLTELRGITYSGGWPELRVDGLLRQGTDDPVIALVRERLVISGDLDESTVENKNLFDGGLYRAVRKFQKRHGLSADGVIGRQTLAAMNVPADYRMRQIEVNLERMRWTSRNLGHRYIIVNIADFTLEVVEHGTTVMKMDVVVGKPFWHTPVFSGKMRYIIVNPSWNVPESIALEEIIPKVKSDLQYLESQQMKIFRNWSDSAEEIDPQTIDWTSVRDDYFPYAFRQLPGPLNPLGTMKFMFPNKYNIYLHDTSAKGLFSRNSRAFSHGCIRVRYPLSLAEYVLRGNPEWTREKIQAIIEKGKEQRINLPAPVDVHIVYLTAWVDGEGVLNFRNDLYGRDELLFKVMRRSPLMIVTTEESQSL